MKCPRCNQPNLYYHKDDDSALCDHCWFMLTEMYMKYHMDTRDEWYPSFKPYFQDANFI